MECSWFGRVCFAFLRFYNLNKVRVDKLQDAATQTQSQMQSSKRRQPSRRAVKGAETLDLKCARGFHLKSVA